MLKTLRWVFPAALGRRCAPSHRAEQRKWCRIFQRKDEIYAHPLRKLTEDRFHSFDGKPRQPLGRAANAALSQITI